MDAADLYRVPLDEFVAARSALVKRLRSSGDREAAAAVARARKPSLGAWVVDQLAHTAPDAIAELLAASADAVEIQRSLLTQEPDVGDELRDASARFAEALEVVKVRAREVLEGSGHPVSDPTLRRAQTTAHAAAVGGVATREALFRGTLDRELDPPGFAAMDELEPDAPDVARAIAARRRPRGPTARRRWPDVPDASRVSRLRAELREAEREATEKGRAADRAVARAARAAERADRLATEALAAREEATTAERAVTPAEDAARSAEALRDAARTSLAAVEHDGGRMPSPMPDVITAYFEADARRDIDGVVGLFTDDAVVVDETETWRGTARIRAWREGPASRYQYTTELFDTERIGGDKYLVRGRLEGDFPGGSAELRWRFTLAGDRIRHLHIAP